MEPAIRIGDVVVIRDAAPSDLRPGHVLLVDDPTGFHDRLLHRFDRIDDNGGLVLRGDANDEADSTPVRPEQVHGVGVLRVPWVGLPVAWAAEGRHLALVGAALALLVLAALSPVRDERDTSLDTDDDGTPDPPEGRHRAGAAQHAVVGAAILLAGGALGALASPASAPFTESTRAPATLSAGYWHTDLFDR